MKRPLTWCKPGVNPADTSFFPERAPLNRKAFAAYVPAEGETSLGRVTCFTCHQGELAPKSAPPAAQH